MLRRDFLVKGAALTAPAIALPGLASCAKATAVNTINIVGTAGNTNLVIVKLIEQMGYFKELGVTPNFVSVADGNKVVASLISGKMDVCPMAGFTQVLAAIEKGAPLKIVAGGAIKSFYSLLSAKPDIKTLKDLEGRSVGVGSLGSQLHQIMVALFTKYGVDLDRIQFVNVGASVDVLKAVVAGTVDAGAAETWLQKGLDVHVLENGDLFHSLPEFINQAGFVSDRAIAEKRDLVVRTLAAYAKVFRFIMSGDSEQAFITASAAALGKHDPDGARAQWTFYREVQPFAADLALSEDKIAFMQDLNIKTGTQKTLLPYARVMDTTLARDALKLV